MDRKKLLQFGIVGAAIVIAFAVYWNIHPENWLKTVGDPVSAEQAAALPPVDSAGCEAGTGFAPIQTLAEFDALLPAETDYVMVAPTEIISTGVYVKMPWWKPRYAAGTKKAHRNRPMPGVTDNPMYAGEYGYSEYQLVRLPDGNYVVALMDRKFAEAAQRGEPVTLPLGRKAGKLEEATRLLKPITEQYGVTEKYVLYTVNDELYQKNDFLATLLRCGIAIGVFAVLVVVIAIRFGSVFTEERAE